MNYDDWKSTPASERYSGPSGVDERPEVLTCRDCGQCIEEGAHGTFAGTYCDGCWRWRSTHGLEFDARAKAQLLAAERRTA